MLDKDFIKNFKKMEYDLENVCWIKKLDKNGKISIHPIIFNYDSSKILDIFSNIEYDAFKVYEIFGVNGESKEKVYSSNFLPYELKNAYSQDGEIRNYYRGAEIELESDYSLYKSKKPYPLIITRYDVVKNYNNKIVSKSGLKKICKIYEDYFQKKYQKQVDKFNSINFDKQICIPPLPYTDYSMNFYLDDIYFVVEKSKNTGKKFILPFAVIIDESTGNNYLKNLRFSKEKFKLNYRVNMETSIRLALRYYSDNSNDLEILKIENLENVYHLKSKDDSELAKLKTAKMSIQKIKDLVNEYESAINKISKNRRNKNKQEKDAILEDEFSL